MGHSLAAAEQAVLLVLDQLELEYHRHVADQLVPVPEQVQGTELLHSEVSRRVPPMMRMSSNHPSERWHSTFAFAWPPGEVAVPFSGDETPVEEPSP